MSANPCEHGITPPVAASIPLRRRDGSVRTYATVDASDFEWLNQWTWTTIKAKSDHLYAVRRGDPKADDPRLILMHREIMGLPRRKDGREVDHEDGDGLNNQRSNLRILTHAQNLQNQRSVTRVKASQYRGVIRGRTPGTWVAQAKMGGKNHYLGTYSSEEAAGSAASMWRLQHMPFTVETETLAASPRITRKSSQYRGVVYWRWSKNPYWRAVLNFQGKTVYNGSHATEIEAARAYDQKARELFGIHAKLNFPDEGEADG